MVWDELAKKYDKLWVQNYSLTPTRKAVLDYISRFNNLNKLLDIGCGTGQLLDEVRLMDEGIELYGLDKSEQMLTCAKEKNIGGATFFCTNISEDDIPYNLVGSIDLIVCCHSFPYYINKTEVVNKIYNLLNDGGHAIFVQASVNNFYDKFVMSIIERTAEKADYLSRKDFISLFEDKFKIMEEFQIHEKWYMPSICGFVMSKL